MKRTTEFVLALIGGIFGILGGFIGLFIGGIGQAVQAQGSSQISGLGWGAVIVSIIAIIFSVILKTKTKVSGIILIICAIAGIICISAFYILPAVLIGISGIMCLVKKNPN